VTTWAHFFTKNPLYLSHLPFFSFQIVKICTKKETFFSVHTHTYHFLTNCRKHKISCDSSWVFVWIKLHLRANACWAFWFYVAWHLTQPCLCILYFCAFSCLCEWLIVFKYILIKIVIVFMLFGNTIHVMLVPLHDIWIMNPLTNLEFRSHIWPCLLN
jgi:hypothetical protein